MVELLKRIQAEVIDIDNELSEENQVVTFYRDFFKNNYCGSVESASAANQCDLLIALILRNDPNLSYEEVHDAVYAIEMIPEKLNHEAVDELLHTIEKLETFENYEYVIETLSSKRELGLADIFKKGGALVVAMQKLAEALNTPKEEFAKFIKLYVKEKEKVQEAIAVVMIMKEIAEEREFHQQMLTFVGEDLGIKIKGKQKQRLISKQIQDDWKINSIMQPIKEANSYASQLEQADKNRKRTLVKNKATYEQLEKTIYSALQGGEIRNVDSIVSKIPSSEIKLQTLKLIYKHNSKIYEELSEEYKVLAANDSSHYQVLLAKYGISPETYDVGTVMNCSIDDVESMLKQLIKLNITKSKDLLTLLQTSTLEIINNISSLVERGIITVDLIFNSSNIFNPLSREYEDFMRNLALLQKKKINPHYLTTSESVFITPHTRLQESVKTLEEYNLIQLMKTGMDCRFLAEANLSEAIDTLLELGYEKNLEESLELLNYKDKFDRLRVLKSLNIPVLTTDELIEVLTTEKFIIPDSDIENYIYNAVDHKLPRNITTLTEPKKKTSDISKLSQYESTSRTYDFNGVIISKNKVARNLSMIATTGKTTDRLLYGITKGSTLTDEEFETVEVLVAPRKESSLTKKK